ncbi:hypothetical protein HRbin12_01245 [bacterium HR12]|nr:hypothetical protein HRbin12_01245 [bacterium HR12]
MRSVVAPGSRMFPSLLTASRRAAAALAAGALAGFLVGGVGGRLGMLVLRLTSSPALHGAKTDDGFTIGVVSGETTFLLGVTTVLGALGGLAYLIARSWLPERLRPWGWGLLGALVGGSAIVRPDGIDFTLLDPLPLALAMFVAIPAAGAAVTSLLAERFLRPTSWFLRSSAALPLLLLPTLFVLTLGLRSGGPLGLPALLALLALASFLLSTGVGRTIARLWRSAPVAWLGRAALLSAAISAGVSLVRDAAAIL